MATSGIETLAQSVGQAIARQRQTSGMTQEQVAEHLKIGNEAVSRMERGLVMPTVARLLELADLFGCDASALLLASSNRPTEQAQHLERLLAPLSGADRAMIVNMVEQLATRLTKPS